MPVRWKLLEVLSKPFTCPTKSFALVLPAHAVAKVPDWKLAPAPTAHAIWIPCPLLLSITPVVSAGKFITFFSHVFVVDTV